ncbi:MAG: hypothetical protein WCT16_04975 [Candidatus Buchananbacteria bacterium]
MQVKGVGFIDTPMGGSNIGIPAGSFGIRIRVNCEATDEDGCTDESGRQIMAAMSEQLERGEVNVVCMMNNLIRPGRFFDVALIFKFPKENES